MKLVLGIFFVEIQQKVDKKFGKVKIKAYFCRLNKYITLKKEDYGNRN